LTLASLVGPLEEKMEGDPSAPTLPTLRIRSASPGMVMLRVRKGGRRGRKEKR